jgi:hypothetical protein
MLDNTGCRPGEFFDRFRDGHLPDGQARLAREAKR